MYVCFATIYRNHLLCLSLVLNVLKTTDRLISRSNHSLTPFSWPLWFLSVDFHFEVKSFHNHLGGAG